MSTMDSSLGFISIFRRFSKRIRSIGQGLVPDNSSPRSFSRLSRSCSHIDRSNRLQFKSTPQSGTAASINDLARSLGEQFIELKNLYSYFSTSSGREASDKIARIEEDFEREQSRITYEHNRKIFSFDQQKNRAVSEEKMSTDRSISELKKRFYEQKRELQDSYQEEQADLDTRIEKMNEAHQLECSSWADPYWERYEPLEKTAEAPLTRIGELTMTSKDESLIVPALLPIITGRNVLITAAGRLRDGALNLLKVILLRLLLTIPPGKMKLVLMDPVGLGSNIAEYMHLPQEIVGEKVWTEPDQIEHQLTVLSSHMETVFQKYLRNDFKSMEEFNDHVGEIGEPYRLLVVLNFPINFSEAAAQRLLDIAANGSRTGVYLLLMRDKDLKVPLSFEIAELKSLSTLIDQEGNNLIWKDADFRDCALTIDSLPSVKMTKRLLKIVGERSLMANNIQVPFSQIFGMINDWWTGSSIDELRAPIGLSGARDIVYFLVGLGIKQHALIAGTTGSGKSNLLHVMILSLFINYSPDELELYLVDFKKGIEFKAYAEKKLPHATVIAIQSRREFGLSVLNGIYAELQRRGDLFRERGVQNLGEFRKKYPGYVMPRIVLFVDEFQVLFVEDDRISGEASLCLDKLTRLGRAFGTHVVLASQTIAGPYSLSRTTMDQMAVRIAFKSTEQDSRMILGEDNPCAKLLSRPGEAYYNDTNGLIEGNALFQAVFLPDDERDKFLDRLYQLSLKRKAVRKQKTIVFEGDAPSSITTNKSLGNLLASHGTLASQNQTLKAWLGEPIAMKPHTAVVFERQSRSNLLIAGKNEESAAAMLISSFVSLAAQRSPDRIKFYMIDLSKPETKWKGVIKSLNNIFPHKISLHDRHSAEEGIFSIFHTVKDRENENAEQEGDEIFLFLVGIHRAAKLRSVDGYTYPEGAEQLFHVLSNGPEAGMFTMCWGDTVKNIGRILGRNIYEFGLRVALQTTVNDSNELIDTSDASRLGKFNAILYDEDRSGDLEKFRPYALPTQEWLESVGKRLRR